MELTVLPLPHDLVRLSPGHGAAIASNAPSWVRTSLARAPWAVVRNGHAADGKVPVGIRETTRDQLWAASADRTGDHRGFNLQGESMTTMQAAFRATDAGSPVASQELSLTVGPSAVDVGCPGGGGSCPSTACSWRYV
jgi:hypothetical protein